MRRACAGYPRGRAPGRLQSCATSSYFAGSSVRRRTATSPKEGPDCPRQSSAWTTRCSGARGVPPPRTAPGPSEAPRLTRPNNHGRPRHGRHRPVHAKSKPACRPRPPTGIAAPPARQCALNRNFTSSPSTSQSGTSSMCGVELQGFEARGPLSLHGLHRTPALLRMLPPDSSKRRRRPCDRGGRT